MAIVGEKDLQPLHCCHFLFIHALSLLFPSPDCPTHLQACSQFHHQPCRYFIFFTHSRPVCWGCNVAFLPRAFVFRFWASVACICLSVSLNIQYIYLHFGIKSLNWSPVCLLFCIWVLHFLSRDRYHLFKKKSLNSPKVIKIVDKNWIQFHTSRRGSDVNT